MGLFDLYKALVSPFTANTTATASDQPDRDKTTNDASQMPDISTQTPRKWGNNTNAPDELVEKSTRRPKTRRGIANTRMDEPTWSDCWRVIEKWMPEKKSEGNGEAGVRDEDVDMADDIPPTPGSDRSPIDDFGFVEGGGEVPEIAMEDVYHGAAHLEDNAEVPDVALLKATTEICTQKWTLLVLN